MFMIIINSTNSDKQLAWHCINNVYCYALNRVNKVGGATLDARAVCQLELPRSHTAVTDRAAHLSCARLLVSIFCFLFKYLSCCLVNLVVVLPDVPG